MWGQGGRLQLAPGGTYIHTRLCTQGSTPTPTPRVPAAPLPASLPHSSHRRGRREHGGRGEWGQGSHRPQTPRVGAAGPRLLPDTRSLPLWGPRPGVTTAWLPGEVRKTFGFRSMVSGDTHRGPGFLSTKRPHSPAGPQPALRGRPAPAMTLQDPAGRGGPGWTSQVPQGLSGPRKCPTSPLVTCSAALGTGDTCPRAHRCDSSGCRPGRLPAGVGGQLRAGSPSQARRVVLPAPTPATRADWLRVSACKGRPPLGLVLSALSSGLPPDSHPRLCPDVGALV